MPLNVDIRINTSLIGRLRISRMEPLEEGQDHYMYLATYSERETGRLFEADFVHNRSEGPEVCVEKALAALREASHGG